MLLQAQIILAILPRLFPSWAFCFRRFLLPNLSLQMLRSLKTTNFQTLFDTAFWAKSTASWTFLLLSIYLFMFILVNPSSSSSWKENVCDIQCKLSICALNIILPWYLISASNDTIFLTTSYVYFSPYSSIFHQVFILLKQDIMAKVYYPCEEIMKKNV